MKSGHDFSVSTSQDIEECDSAYKYIKIKNSKCLKKIPENDCNFIKFHSFCKFFFLGHLETKFCTDFSVSGICNIEEFDSIYENKIKKLQMPKKNPRK